MVELGVARACHVGILKPVQGALVALHKRHEKSPAVGRACEKKEHV
jgi:hypothetical protein